MIKALTSLLRRFRRETAGVSAVEFALIAPFMILLYLGAVEVSLALSIDRKITSVSSALADLVAQDDIITDDEMNDILNAGAVIVAPFSTEPLQIRISSVFMNPDESVEVTWSDALNTSPLAEGGSVAVPQGVLDRNRSSSWWKWIIATTPCSTSWASTGSTFRKSSTSARAVPSWSRGIREGGPFL